MGWEISETGFHIVLSPDVPKVIREKPGWRRGYVPGRVRNQTAAISRVGSSHGRPKFLRRSKIASISRLDALKLSWSCLTGWQILSSASSAGVLQGSAGAPCGKPGTYSVLAARGLVLLLSFLLLSLRLSFDRLKKLWGRPCECITTRDKSLRFDS